MKERAAIDRVWKANLRVRSKEVWCQLRREMVEVARCMAERLSRRQTRSLPAITFRFHFRSVSPVQPIFRAIEQIAAHCESYSAWCYCTIRTARSRLTPNN